MTIYNYIAEKGDRRTALYKALSKHYDALCEQNNETPAARDFANLEFDEAFLTRLFVGEDLSAGISTSEDLYTDAEYISFLEGFPNYVKPGPIQVVSSGGGKIFIFINNKWVKR